MNNKEPVKNQWVVYGVVYLIRNVLDGRYYVGRTTKFKKRRAAYKALRCEKQPRIYEAIKKDGWHNFTMVPIAEAFDKYGLRTLETYFIDEFDCLNPFFGYNLAKGWVDKEWIKQLEFRKTKEYKEKMLRSQKEKKEKKRLETVKDLKDLLTKNAERRKLLDSLLGTKQDCSLSSILSDFMT